MIVDDTFRTLAAPGEFRDRGSKLLAFAQAYQLRYLFEQMNEVMRLVKEQPLTVLKQDYDTTRLLEIEVRKSKVGLCWSAWPNWMGSRSPLRLQ